MFWTLKSPEIFWELCLLVRQRGVLLCTSSETITESVLNAFFFSVVVVTNSSFFFTLSLQQERERKNERRVFDLFNVQNIKGCTFGLYDYDHKRLLYVRRAIWNALLCDERAQGISSNERNGHRRLDEDAHFWLNHTGYGLLYCCWRDWKVTMIRTCVMLSVC